MGMSFRSGILLDLSISKFTWKQIVKEKLNRNDLRRVDLLFVKDLEKIEEEAIKMTDEEFTKEFGTTHTMSVMLSNNQVVDLEENGHSNPLTR